MIAFIDDHRAVHGVEPICRELPIAPSTYHAHAARRADPSKALGPRPPRRPASRPCPAGLGGELPGLRRAQGLAPARPRRDRGGAMHGRPPDAPDGSAGDCSRKIRENHDQRQGGALSARPGEPRLPGSAPNRLWVSDFTYVATWAGFVYVAFVIDAYARRIVGWRVSRDRRGAASSSMPWSRRCTPGSPCADRPGPPQRQSVCPSPAFLGGLTLTAMDRLAWLAPQGVSSRCDPHSDRPRCSCLSPDLSAVRDALR